jgi:urease alpha subunit
MDMPIHMIWQLLDEAKKKGKEEGKQEEKERIRRVIQKHVIAPTLLQQILADIDRETEVQENG